MTTFRSTAAALLLLLLSLGSTRVDGEARKIFSPVSSLSLRGGAVSSKTKKKLATVKNKKTADDNIAKASMSSSIFNLVNNVAGAGILTLSAGMAAGPTGWVPALLVCAVLGFISSHTFSLIGKACELTGESTFQGLWGRTIGHDTTYIVDGIVAVMCLACAVIYSGILGDVFTPLLQSIGVDSLSRGSIIVIISVLFLLPMSLIKDLSSLAFTSIMGFSAIMYTVVFCVVRALDKTYALDPPGKFIADGIITKPSFTKSSLWSFGPSSLVLISNLGLAYIAHYNGPNFYRSLKQTSSKKFAKMVGIAFAILTALYMVIMSAGFSTFGEACMGNLLLNYHPNDVLSTLGRAATGFSILFGFPLVACGAREGIQGATSSLGLTKIASSHGKLVVSILALVTYIAVTVQDVSLVVGLTGAAMGSFIVYICPVIIYTKTVLLTKGVDSIEYRKAKQNLALVPFGIFIGLLGVYMTLFQKQ